MEEENIIDELKITYIPKEKMKELKKDPLYVARQNAIRQEYGLPPLEGGYAKKSYREKNIRNTNKRAYNKEYNRRRYAKYKAQKNKITNPSLKTSDIIPHDPICKGVRYWNNERKAYTCDKCEYNDPITYTPQ